MSPEKPTCIDSAVKVAIDVYGADGALDGLRREREAFVAEWKARRASEAATEPGGFWAWWERVVSPRLPR